jgi:hypothetical protein
MEFDDDTLVIDRTPSELDEIVPEFTEILDEENIEYVIVSGYIAILTRGRLGGFVMHGFFRNVDWRDCFQYRSCMRNPPA